MPASPSRIAARWLKSASLSQDATEFLEILALNKPKFLPMNAAAEALGALGLDVSETTIALEIKDYSFQLSPVFKAFGVRGIKGSDTTWRDPSWFELRFSSPRSASSGLKKLNSVGKAVSSKPSNPRPKTLYVKDLEHDGQKTVTGKAWIGVFSWVVSGLSGGPINVPLDNDGRGQSRELVKALKEQGYDEKAFEVLNSDEGAVPSAPEPSGSSGRDLDGTGTCPACFANVKLNSSDKILRHGWTEMGGRQKGNYGQAWHSGACFGVGFKPYELSKEGTEKFREKKVLPLIAELERTATGLEEGTEPIRSESKTIDPGDDKYSRYQPGAIRAVRSQILETKKDLRTLDARISGWKPQPLPGKTASVELPPWGYLLK